MSYKLNKEILLQIIEEFDIALSQSRKSRNEIFSTLVLQNPEITCSIDEWQLFSPDIRTNIIARIKDTLIHM